MGRRGPRPSGKRKWGLGIRVSDETYNALQAWCAENKITPARMFAQLAEDKHAQILLDSVSTDEPDDKTRQR